MPAAAPPLRPDSTPILHHYPAYRRDPLAFWRDTGRMAPVVRVRFGPFHNYWVVTDPGLLQHVLQQRPRSYPRQRRLMRLARRGGPELLFNTDRWEEWLWRRRLMQPSLHRQQIAGFAEAMVEEAAQLCDGWADGEVRDLEVEMKRLTMRIIARTMFSVRDRPQVDRLRQVYEGDSDWTYRQASAPVALPIWVPTPQNRRARAAMRARGDDLRRVVEDRFHQDEPRGDLLDLLIGAHLEDGRRFTAEQLLGEVAGMVFAGHETTASTLMWGLYAISGDAGIEAALREEIDRVVGQRPPALADLEQLALTQRCVLETLRCYPPVYVTLREADEDDQFEGLRIPKGTSLVINIRGLHHHPQYWPEPERFDPGRFEPQVSAGRPKYCFLPFLEGPRKCMGDAFAMMEMRLVLPVLLQRFRFAYAGAEPPREQPGFVMGSATGMPMRITAR